jgi:hypothetical protein
MMSVRVNQRAEMERMEARILLEDLLEAWKHTRMFPASQVFLTFEKKAYFLSNTNQPLLFLGFTNFKSNHRRPNGLVLA